MGKNFEGLLLGKGLKFGVVVSRFNEFNSKKLLAFSVTTEQKSIFEYWTGRKTKSNSWPFSSIS